MSPVLAAAVALAIFAVVASLTFFAVRARRRKLARKPVREASGFLILEANAWESCAVDDVHEPWARLATEPVRGFCGVSPGRHRVRTATPGGEATIDFVVYPGEVLAWRLDAEHARWEPHDLDPETRSKLEAAPASSFDVAASARPKLPGWLVHLRTTVRLASARGAVPASSAADAFDRVQKRLAKLVGRAESGTSEPHADSLVEARGIGETLVGRGLTRREMRALVAPVREASARLSAHGDAERAMQIVGLGLAVLPGDPELMIEAGSALAARGESDEAMRAFEAALERDRCLEPDDVARAMRARMELKARLGRSVRV